MQKLSQMDSLSGQSSVGCGTSTNLQFFEVIPTKRNPNRWKNYSLCKLSSGPNKARCKLCGSFFKHDASSTLKNHHGYKYCKALKNEAPRGQPTMENDGSIYAYRVDAVQEQMAQFIVMGRNHELILEVGNLWVGSWSAKEMGVEFGWWGEAWPALIAGCLRPSNQRWEGLTYSKQGRRPEGLLIGGCYAGSPWIARVLLDHALLRVRLLGRRLPDCSC
ncbi:hypothetical protein E3N88_15641 [Mikania micrantha]|uniref:Uncharacterized protein n=1 Tax=Mikania micrantha TaxID=192012 RepID=A0A5N6NXT7_9ASTR|nr:hypothetical protein E3N88_15641 [Mikania micrantha]